MKGCDERAPPPPTTHTHTFFYYSYINCLCKCFINKLLDQYFLSFASLPLAPLVRYSMTKYVIYTCLRETFPHLKAVSGQREGRGWERGVEPIVDISIYNSLFLWALKD